MKCFDLMTTPVRTVRGDENVLVAACLMREHEVGYLPVCDDTGRVVGVLTERDLAVGVCAENEAAADVLVRHVMTAPPITCPQHATIVETQRQMLAHHHAVLTVVDEQRHPVGVISLWDIFEGRDGHLRRERGPG
jgi:CBS domain-containing protein